MKFEFEIDMDELLKEDDWGDVYSINFNTMLRDKVVACIANELLQRMNCGPQDCHWNDEVNSIIRKILKARESDIVEGVINKVADGIIKKKTIIEMTPKARELAATDKDNEKYFIELIDKAIAKRFNK